MITGPVALAFTAGMVATFNPCGFSLLPAYIGAFVAGDQTDQGIDRRLIRAVAVAAAVSVGFVVAFAAIGLIIDSVAGEVRRQLPWVTIAIGMVLVVTGLAMATGWKPTIAVGGPRLGAGGRGPAAMVGYGVTYAVASLSCTIGPFLAVTGTTLSQSPLQGLMTYVAYALGMGFVILGLSVASALAHSTFATYGRRFSRVAPRFGGALMILAGGYAIWYGRWELAVYSGDLSGDRLVTAVEDVRIRMVDVVQSVGPGLLAVVLSLGILFVIAMSRFVVPVRDSEASAAARPGPDAPEPGAAE